MPPLNIISRACLVPAMAVLLLCAGATAQDRPPGPDTKRLEEQILTISKELEGDLEKQLAGLKRGSKSVDEAAAAYKAMQESVQRVLAAYGPESPVLKEANRVSEVIEERSEDARKRYRETGDEKWLGVQQVWERQRVQLRDQLLRLDRAQREAQRSQAFIEENRPYFEHLKAQQLVQEALNNFDMAVNRFEQLSGRLGELVASISGSGEAVPAQAPGAAGG